MKKREALVAVFRGARATCTGWKANSPVSWIILDLGVIRFEGADGGRYTECDSDLEEEGWEVADRVYSLAELFEVLQPGQYAHPAGVPEVVWCWISEGHALLKVSVQDFKPDRLEMPSALYASQFAAKYVLRRMPEEFARRQRQ